MRVNSYAGVDCNQSWFTWPTQLQLSPAAKAGATWYDLAWRCSVTTYRSSARVERLPEAVCNWPSSLCLPGKHGFFPCAKRAPIRLSVTVELTSPRRRLELRCCLWDTPTV